MAVQRVGIELELRRQLLVTEPARDSMKHLAQARAQVLDDRELTVAEEVRTSLVEDADENSIGVGEWLVVQGSVDRERLGRALVEARRVNAVVEACRTAVVLEVNRTVPKLVVDELSTASRDHFPWPHRFVHVFQRGVVGFGLFGQILEEIFARVTIGPPVVDGTGDRWSTRVNQVDIRPKGDGSSYEAPDSFEKMPSLRIAPGNELTELAGKSQGGS
jgi:hypothetical protein